MITPTEHQGLASPVILITGASRGIGAATAMMAAQAGYRVAVNYHSNAIAAQNLVGQIQAAGTTAIAVQADVADEAQVLRMFAAVDDQLGCLRALVNCAGVVDVASRVDGMTVARLRRMFDTNVIGSMLCAREAVLRMSTRHGGSGGAIVNLSSVAATLGSAGQYVDYAACKGAIDTFTVGLAREVAQEGIRVNAVRPRHHRHGDPRVGRAACTRAATCPHHSDATTGYSQGSCRCNLMVNQRGRKLRHWHAA
jgi:NAD(P)-dependent dehydrogenase (short-subunit alcohol dehydrogenase family)